MDHTRVVGPVLLAMLLVVLPAIVMLSGSVSGYGEAVTASPPENLKAIAALGDRWLVAMGAFVGIILLMAVGLGLLTATLYGTGDRLLAPSAFILFMIGSVLFLVWLSFQGSVTLWAAQETVRTSATPAVYEPFMPWADRLFVGFKGLSYLSIFGFGRALLRTGLLPKWVGWGSLLLGVVGVIDRVSGLVSGMVAGVPAWIPFWGLLIGVALLLKR